MATITLGINLANVNTSRASIVPYVIVNSHIFFLLGRDQKSGDITDLGGGVKKYESTLLAAFREFNEESDDILGKQIRPNNQWQSVALLDEHMGVLFVPLESRWLTEATHRFNIRKEQTSPRKRSHSEIEELWWVGEKDFMELIKSRNSEERMWDRLRVFYRKNYKKPLRESLRIAYPY